MIAPFFVWCRTCRARVELTAPGEQALCRHCGRVTTLTAAPEREARAVPYDLTHNDKVLFLKRIGVDPGDLND